MAIETLNQILKQLETLEITELQQLNQAIQKYLVDKQQSRGDRALEVLALQMQQ
ncbi:hypothetical protein H6H01_10745 [Nostoc calcicola FACHB-3891]|nr:hypothetical protein [Nostoc calcicola FACHB-3891]